MFNDGFVLEIKNSRTDLVFEMKDYDCNCHDIGKISLCHISISKFQSNCMNCWIMFSAVKFIIE